jgi:hypothetical protein
MSALRVASSETELIQLLCTTLRRRSNLLIGLDGMYGTGKSSLSRLIGASLNCSVIECDLFIRNGELAYPEILDLKCLDDIVSVAVGRNRPIVVESIMLKLVLSAIKPTDAFHVYVRHSWPQGKLTHPELFDPTCTEEALISEENKLCRAAGIADDSPVLYRELISYHKQFSPHENANYLFETSFKA